MATSTILKRIETWKENFRNGKHPDLKPAKWDLWQAKARASGTLPKHGVRLVSKEDNKKQMFVCLASDTCAFPDKSGEVRGRQVKIFGSSTGKATEHIAKVHGVTTERTKKLEAKVASKGRVQEKVAPAFAADPTRFVGNSLGVWAAKHGISYNAFQDSVWNDGICNCFDVGQDALMNFDPRKFQVEQFVHLKSVISDDIQEARNSYEGMPAFSYNLDLYTDPLQSRKFMAMRVSWIDIKSNVLQSRNIAMRDYSASYAEKHEVTASQMLDAWATAVLDEFGLGKDDMFAGSGDGGPDVSKVMQDFFKDSMTEWCISHLLNRCFLDAFGTDIDPSKSKNKAARVFIDKVRKVIESINKSDDLKSAFEEARASSGAKADKKLRNAPHHRWGSTADSLFRVLYEWKPLKLAFAKCKIPFPLEKDHVVLQEFYSVMKSLRDLQVKAQSKKEPNLTMIYIEFMSIRNTTLKPSAPLLILDVRPTSASVVASIPKPREHDKLHPATQAVREKLLQAVDARFFIRMNPIKSMKNWRVLWGSRVGNTSGEAMDMSHFKQGYVFDMAMLLNPRFRDGRHIDHLTARIPIEQKDIDTLPSQWKSDWSQKEKKLRKHFAGVLKESLWKKILILGMHVAEKKFEDVANHALLEESQESGFSTPPRKKGRFAAAVFDAGLASPDASMAEEEDEDDSSIPETPEAMVAKEIETFKLMKKEPAGTCATDKEVLKWWDERKDRFPCLRLVVKSIHGMLAGSGALELDIGSFKDVISPKRATTSAGMVEVQLLIKVNKSLVELDTREIKDLGNNWKSYTPKRPSLPANYWDEDNENSD